MQAAVVYGPAQAPTYQAIEAPDSAAGLVVEVLAVALSPRVRSGASGRHYSSSGVFPLVPGIDGVGRLPDGRRVYFVGASDTRGTMAQQALAEPSLTVTLPDGVGSATIAAGMLPAISSWFALSQRVHLEKGQSVLVLGATGTAGRLAIQIAKRLGADTVVAVGRRADGLERLRALGADCCVQLVGDRDDGRRVAQAASEVDVVLDYLWGEVTSMVMPEICRRREAESKAVHWVVIGSAAGDEVSLSSVLLRKRNLHILGSGQGASSASEMLGVAPDIVAAFAARELQVEAREAPLAEVGRWWEPEAHSGARVVFIP